MKEKIFIGCDIGTSSTKTVAVDINGKVLAQAVKSYGIIQKHHNWAEQDAAVWFEAAAETIQAVVKKIDEKAVEAICISALYGGTGVMCDASMESIRPSIIWMDRRAEEESRWIRKNVGEDRIFEISGNGIDSYFGFTKLLWVKNHEPENWKKIRFILPVHSYILYKLTGKVTVDYCSAGNVGGIFDYRLREWSEEMCTELGIPYEALPKEFHAPGEIIGTLNAEYQEKLGFNHEVKICAGTVDCIASMISATIVRNGDNAAVLGTSLNWGFLHDRLPDNPSLVSMPYGFDSKKLSYTYGGASTAGALPRWFVKSFFGNEDASNYELLEKEIAENQIGAGSNGIIVLPYFMGERTPIWDENATGLIFGLTLSHTRAHIYRAVLESVAYSLLHIMEAMTGDEDDVRKDKINKIILVGGGSKSELWKSIFADVTGLPVYTPVNPVEAPLGDAFMAAMGTENIKETSVIEEWVKMNPPVNPVIENNVVYKKYFEMYKQLYMDLKDTMGRHSRF
ncbi:FGGY-family carbohydrate kinase [Anaerocolumna xylanovorans]|uniref:Xylulokinase n=1 Tax=Anaerocolumna xylanovorans DSM 12503 TaxID=1121345 RepID=A0A1M7YN28_9FIRM|nr:FGGY-family carbohydrate kinase [Anaerocolumna xylanovorans]SHO54053.1 xylulokinase [Anaerocolumna xylanovorans DSM 12503]